MSRSIAYIENLLGYLTARSIERLDIASDLTIFFLSAFCFGVLPDLKGRPLWVDWIYAAADVLHVWSVALPLSRPTCLALACLLALRRLSITPRRIRLFESR
jgi:hypothetical protein